MSPIGAPPRQTGLSLIELMIALLLGAIVVGGTLGIFHASSQTNRRTEDLARIQESARTAFELMGRSLREADGNACGVGNIDIKSGIGDEDSCWSGGAKFDDPLRGYEGGRGFPAACGKRPVAGSDALVLVSSTEDATPIVSFANGKLTLQRAGDFRKNDIVFACNHDTGKGAMFKLAATPAANSPTIDYAEKMHVVAKVNA
ncbi:MAG: prepilin-type N-terminal cleavage/methylation domain-containing protein, partial [Azoarcus sp.]|nr:prepilin-type N-terminal cleavage/methylation domain-containing protein [Azoarcus sp.]